MSHGVHAVHHEVEHEIKSGNGHGEHGGHGTCSTAETRRLHC